LEEIHDEVIGPGLRRLARHYRIRIRPRAVGAAGRISSLAKLEEEGLVTRTRQSSDGRVVLVSLTQSGNVALEDYRGRLRAVLGGYLAEIADEQVEALATATETLAQLVRVLQQRPAR
jgi:hypothetical protein